MLVTHIVTCTNCITITSETRVKSLVLELYINVSIKNNNWHTLYIISKITQRTKALNIQCFHRVLNIMINYNLSKHPIVLRGYVNIMCFYILLHMSVLYTAAGVSSGGVPVLAAGVSSDGVSVLAEGVYSGVFQK